MTAASAACGAGCDRTGTASIAAFSSSVFLTSRGCSATARWGLTGTAAETGCLCASGSTKVSSLDKLGSVCWFGACVDRTTGCGCDSALCRCAGGVESRDAVPRGVGDSTAVPLIRLIVPFTRCEPLLDTPDLLALTGLSGEGCALCDLCRSSALGTIRREFASYTI